MITVTHGFVKGAVMHNRRVIVILIHLLQTALANYLAFAIRFESLISHPDTYYYFNKCFTYLPLLLVIRLGFYLRTGLHKDLWRYSSMSNLVNIIKTTLLGSVIFFIIVRYIIGDLSYPFSIYILDWLLILVISGGSRLLIRIFREHLRSEDSGKRTLLIGAGDAGEMIVRDMKNNPQYNFKPIGFIDDDPYKKGLSIHGVPILGRRSVMKEIIDKYMPEEILISMPSASYQTTNEIYELCKPFDIPIKTLPGLSDILDGKVSVSQIKSLSLEDLLQREPMRTDIETVKEYIKGKSVLVTGAGGSIGSELCRQIIEYGPSNLIILDRYENSLFRIDLELRKKHPEKKISTVVGDIRDVEGIEDLFSIHKPQIVFHAAAHKHVPLMELNPLEAVKNNIFGTRNLLFAALDHYTEAFVMISTDKAVNPTSIMGATKKVAELLTMSMNRVSSAKFTTVRFGNVLGSNGSVIQIFKEQLKQGGPLTVTHPEMRRYFMLIREAVQLVLIASTEGFGGDIFVLDMGELIKIIDLAENLIRLSGFIPHEDIKIEFTGLRQGEKLFEELFDESENIVPTPHEKLRVALPNKLPSMDELLNHVAMLERIVESNSVEELVPELQRIVPNFKKPDLSVHKETISQIKPSR